MKCIVFLLLSGTVLSALHALSYLILPTTLASKASFTAPKDLHYFFKDSIFPTHCSSSLSFSISVEHSFSELKGIWEMFDLKNEEINAQRRN